MQSYIIKTNPKRRYPDWLQAQLFGCIPNFDGIPNLPAACPTLVACPS